ncbi:probable lipase [Moritella sp. PE36]|uniref:lipase family protein n=1 Tax=Moritella sp. PE36 TaxID=58051 RepID=UPI0001568DBE|nr:lipase family protein [Moritella sp. PE36]EDM65946.1 probable lipase [Moritella sp. PE36]
MKIEESLLHVCGYVSSEDWESANWTTEKAFVCSVMSNLAYTQISQSELADHDNVKMLPSSTYHELLSSKSTEFRKYFNLLDTDERLVIERPGVVVVGTKINDVVFISMRGTRLLSIKDWRINLNARKVSPFPAKRIKIHKGFYFEVQSFYEELMGELIKRKWHESPVYFVGHSLGGALSAITYAMCDHYGLYFSKQRRFLLGYSACYTFGMPRWGNSDAMAILESPKHFFVENDLVPKIPLESLGYSNCTNNISIDSTTFSYVKYKGVVSYFTDYLNLIVGNKFKDHSIETYVERLFQKLCSSNN